MVMEPLFMFLQLSLRMARLKLSEGKRYTGQPLTSTSTPFGVPGQRSSPSSKTPSPSRSGLKTPSTQACREKDIRLPPSLGAVSRTSSTHSPSSDSPFREAREPKGATVPPMAGVPEQSKGSPPSSNTALMLLSSPQLLDTRTTRVPMGEIR